MKEVEKKIVFDNDHDEAVHMGVEALMKMKSSSVLTTNRAGSGTIGVLDSKYLDANALLRIKEYLDKRIDDLSKNPLYQHKCSSCGGTVELDIDKAIFICPYCGSHYALAPNRINDVG